MGPAAFRGVMSRGMWKRRGCFDIRKDNEQLVFATPSGSRITKQLRP